MNPDHPWTRMQSKYLDSVRVLLVSHVHGDTYAIREDEEVSLSDGATLTILLKQLSGRDTG